jgi:hypothetical protein
VRRVDEVAELVGRPVADRRREQAHGLIAPGAVEGVLAEGQELDVRETHVGDVVHQFLRRLPVGQHAVVLVGLAAPGPEMHLVDADRRLAAVAARALSHPLRVVPAVAADIAHDRRIFRWVLRAEADGVRFQRLRCAAAITDPVLVARPLADARDERLPDARTAHG